MKKEREIRYYTSYSDDFTQSADQNYKVPDDYKWVRTDIWSRFLSGLTYALALVFSTIYCRLFLHVRIKGAKKLRSAAKTGAFVYGNHTQPVGDVFDPALACFPGRIYTLASPANLGIPVLGKILPYLGALPLTDSVQGMKRLMQAVELRLEQKSYIVIYPEAHVWEYCTDIRPFAESSFKFPVKFDKPSYSLTMTYQKRRFGSRPRAAIYVDGPFYPSGSGTVREQTSELCGRVHDCMVRRSQKSTYSYIEYRHIAEQSHSEPADERTPVHGRP